MRAGIKKHFLPALLLALCAIFPSISGCKIVHNASPISASGTATPTEFDARSYVDGLWDTTLLPYYTSKAVDLGLVVDALYRNVDQAGQKYGRRADAEGSPWSFSVKGKARLISINTASRAGTLVAEIVTDSGIREVTLQIGPVVKGSSIRDSVPFFSFENVTNQIEYAQVGRAFNERTLQHLVPILSQLKTAGTEFEFYGALSINSLPETFIVTPVLIKVIDGASS